MAQEYTNGFYMSRAWLECRDTYMRTVDYICERCGVPAKIVHHKEYITPKTINDPSVTLSHDNLKHCVRTVTTENIMVEIMIAQEQM